MWEIHTSFPNIAEVTPVILVGSCYYLQVLQIWSKTFWNHLESLFLLIFPMIFLVIAFSSELQFQIHSLLFPFIQIFWYIEQAIEHTSSCFEQATDFNSLQADFVVLNSSLKPVNNINICIDSRICLRKYKATSIS